MSDLDRRYLHACREVHPDYQQELGLSFVHAAEMHLSALHTAYAVLADPYRRAVHLLELAHGPAAHEYRAVPADFMEQMFELRERMANLVKPSDRARFEDEITDMLQQAELKLDASCENLSQPENRVQLRERLNQIAFLRGIQRDLDGTKA